MALRLIFMGTPDFAVPTLCEIVLPSPVYPCTRAPLTFVTSRHRSPLTPTLSPLGRGCPLPEPHHRGFCLSGRSH